MPSGIYRVTIENTFFGFRGCHRFLEWEMRIRGPLGVSGVIFKRSRIVVPKDVAALRREFAVLGVPLETESGFERARKTLLGASAFVEVLPDDTGWQDRVHILQRATTHDVAVPGDCGLTEWERVSRTAADREFCKLRESAPFQSALDPEE